MRVSTLILLVTIGFVVGSVEDAAAEKVRTNQSTKVFARPGEQAKVLLTVKSGQNMTVIEEEGRWLKVRVKGRTGYVPRSKVDMADDDEIVRNTRRRPFVDGRSRRRGFGGASAPEDRVGADAVDVATADEEEEEEEEEDEEEEDEEEERPRKAKAKQAAARTSVDDEDEEEDEEELSDEEDEEDPIDEDEEEEPARRTARATKKVSVYEEPDAESEEIFVAKPNEILFPMETKGAWTEVENEEGDYGWIETEYLEMDGEDGGPARKRVIDVGARLGMMIIQQGMRVPDSMNLKVPDNYNINTPSLSLALGAGIMMPFKGTYILGGELTYDYAKTVFGGFSYDPDGRDQPMPPVTTGLAVHNVNVRAMAGYDFKKQSGMAVLGRLGYRYQSYLIDGYNDPAKNPAQVPQEVMKAPTLGAAFVMPRLTDTIGLRVSLDAILFGASLTQTKGLEDGATPSAKAVVFGAGVTYKWKKSMHLQATYDLRYTGIDFGAPLATSMRMHMGTKVLRTDFFHLLSVGVAKPF